MSLAFEITLDDVRNVMRQNEHGDASSESMRRAFDDLDLELIESAALNGGCEMEEQTNAAYEEIRSQLVEQGWLPKRSTDQVAQSVAV